MAPYEIAWSAVVERLDALADAYMDTPYDALCYVVRGGMAPAHRLAHRLGLGPEQLHALTIRRHAHDGVQAQAHAPVRFGPLPSLPVGARILLVEDTIGSGATLAEALAAIAPSRPAWLDVLTVGLDHADLTRAGAAIGEWPIDRLLVGIDYWGWLVLPWENPVPGAPLPNTPLVLRPAAEAMEQRLAEGAQLWNGLEILRGDRHEALHLRDALPSRIGAEAFRRLLLQVHEALLPGGRLTFGVLDREAIRQESELVWGREYYNARLLSDLAARCGYVRAASSPLDRLRFETWTTSAR